MTEKRRRQGNEVDILVLHARTAEEATRARDVLAQIGISLEIPEAAVQVLFAEGAESVDIRVPLDRADDATSAIQESFGPERIPSREDAKGKGTTAPSLSEIEARAKEMEEEDERLRQEAEAAEAARAARGPEAEQDDPAAETWTETIVYGLISLVLLVLFVWGIARM